MHWLRWSRWGDATIVHERVRTVCAIESCGKDVRGQGLCNAHLKRFVKWGDANVCRPTVNPSIRFWSHVEKNGPIPAHRPDLGPCWIWTRYRARGYGKFGPAHNNIVLAHRFAYEDQIGAIPEGLTLDHLCFNPPCVNPAHMEPVTMTVNAQRALKVRHHGHASLIAPVG